MPKRPHNSASDRRSVQAAFLTQAALRSTALLLSARACEMKCIVLVKPSESAARDATTSARLSDLAASLSSHRRELGPLSIRMSSSRSFLFTCCMRTSIDRLFRLQTRLQSGAESCWSESEDCWSPLLGSTGPPSKIRRLHCRSPQDFARCARCPLNDIYLALMMRLKRFTEVRACVGPGRSVARPQHASAT